MNNLTEKQAEQITILLKSIIKKFHRYVMEQISVYGLTVPQMLLLNEVYNNPDISVRELSEKLDLAKSTVCGIVDRLERQGAVIRVRDESDRRVVKIKLAPNTPDIREKLSAAKTNYLVNLIRDFPPEETEQIVNSLHKLDDLMGGAEE